MKTLLNLTLAMGLTDSLNPFGIAQQFALQGLVKKSRDIWYYIITMLLTNFVAGILLYLGMQTLGDKLLQQYWETLRIPLVIIVFIMALVLGYYSIRSLLINWKARKLLAGRAEKEAKELETKLSKKKLTPATLVSIGFFTTVMELTTAAPYIAYLTIVQQFELQMGAFLAILIFYNVLYTLPLILLYVLSVFFKDTFDIIYRKLSSVLQFFSAFLLPALLLVIAILLLVVSVRML